MSSQTRKDRAIVVLSLILLLLTALACGSSTTEQLAESAAATDATPSVEDSGDGAEPQATTAPDAANDGAEDVGAPTEEPPTAIANEDVDSAQDAVVDKQGFGQDGRSAAYAFVLSNPNEAFGIEDIGYQIAAKDADGVVVATDSGNVPALFPSESLGVAGTLFVDEGITISSVEVQLSAGEPVATDPVPNFAVESATYLPGDFTNAITGVITSPFDRPFEDIRVSAITYGPDEQITGGGFTFVNFVPAGGSTGASVSVTSTGEVARVELYPSVSILSLFADSPEVPEGATEIELLNYGFGEDGMGVGYAFLVSNPNSAFSVETSMFRATAYDAEGTVLGTDEGYIEVLLPGQTTGVAGSLFSGADTPVERVEVQVQGGDFVESGAVPSFTTENVTFLPSDFMSEITGSVVNPYDQEVTDLRVSAIAYDDTDKVIGGGFTFLDFVPANGSSAVSVSVNVTGVPARVEMYANVSGITQIGE